MNRKLLFLRTHLFNAARVKNWNTMKAAKSQTELFPSTRLLNVTVGSSLVKVSLQFLTICFAGVAMVSRSAPLPPPTHANVPYGDHPRQVLDFYKAEADKPTPLVFCIHGGGWGALSKDRVSEMLDVPRLLTNGISVVAINYRYFQQAKVAGIEPPVKWPLEDAARALQFVRSKAAEWNLDKQRIGANGGSAGACSSLWLALHDDMAQPNSPDPVARESTRLWCAAVSSAQTSLDPKTMREWMPNITYGGHAFGFHTDGKDQAVEFQRFFDGRDKVLPFIREYSPMEHASADDPPLWLTYSQKQLAVKGEAQADPTHSALFGLMLEEKLKPLGVKMILTYPAKPTGPFRTATDYFIATFASPKITDAPRWQLHSTGDGWRLVKDGKPFYIQGAVAINRFDELKTCGGNAARVNATKALLDAAQQTGLVALVNLPVRGERDGLDWNNALQVAEQKAKILGVVKELKDHPAVMFWSVGNELDHIPGNKPYNPQIWARLNDLAAAIKKLDPLHPVMTVVGTGHYEQKIQEMAAACKDMDLLGVNTYGDIQQATELTRKHWPKPYVVSEWGPTGHWEVSKTKWRAPLEQTSTEKARAVEERYRNIIQADRAHCLGSFIFCWKEKQETTHTWYGLFCNGLQTESIDVMQFLWTGARPTNRSPAITALQIKGFTEPQSTQLRVGKTYSAIVTATDPDSDPLVFAWNIRPEVVIPPGSYAGGMEKKALPIPGLIPNPAAAAIEFTAPSQPGAYRLFVTSTDGRGHIAYGNIPFYAKE